ncbi:MAG: hypothetical protein ACOC3C_07165 [Candidatus Thorarchaeota archaeon]
MEENLVSTSFSGSMKIGTPLSSTCDKTEEDARPKTFLVITEKGKKVAEKLREIQELLEE